MCKTYSERIHLKIDKEFNHFIKIYFIEKKHTIILEFNSKHNVYSFNPLIQLYFIKIISDIS